MCDCRQPATEERHHETKCLYGDDITKGGVRRTVHATYSDVYMFLLTCYFEHDVCHRWGRFRNVCSWFLSELLKMCLKSLNKHVSANHISLFSNWVDQI